MVNVIDEIRFPSLRKNEDGLWVSSKSVNVSYPDDGNALCFDFEDNSFWFQHRNNCILHLIKLFPPSGVLLDIGGGNGYVAERILAEGFPVILLEPGSTGAKNAKLFRKLPEVINSTFEDAGFPDESFSAVGIFDVLEHIENDRIFLREIWRIMKPGGRLYATFPAHNFLWSASDTYALHHRRYDRQTIEQIAEHLFELKYFTYFFSILTLPILLIRVLPYHLRKSKPDGKPSNLEFGIRGGKLVDFLSFFLDREFKKIISGKVIPSGTSCMCVLEKKYD